MKNRVEGRFEGQANDSISSSEVPTHRDGAKRRALARLGVSYDEARDFASQTEPHANLEWILGAKKDSSRDMSMLDNKMIGLLALWMNDLAADVSFHPPPLVGEVDPSTIMVSQTRQSLATSLRATTKGVLAAFGQESLTS